MKSRIVALVIVLSAVLGSAFWIHDQLIYDGCVLLDRTLGPDARTPAKLFDAIGWKYDEDRRKNPYGLGYPEFYDVQHQALVRLVSMQKELFGEKGLPQCQRSIGMDSGGALMISFKGGVYVIEGSASIDPDYYDKFVTHDEGYYRWERFSFGKNGKLLGRSPKTG